MKPISKRTLGILILVGAMLTLILMSTRQVDRDQHLDSQLSRQSLAANRLESLKTANHYLLVTRYDDRTIVEHDPRCGCTGAL